MSEKRKYDSTVARIAGNIACGFASKPDHRMGVLADADDVRDYVASLAILSVRLARTIVAEVERTEPAPAQERRASEAPRGVKR